MISTGYCHLMARYNRWQNQALYAAADGLDDDARRADRGAFFGSIMGTLNHLMWGDAMWMSRFDRWQAPRLPIADSRAMFADWAGLTAARRQADQRIVDWAARLSDDDLAADLSWHSAATGTDRSGPVWPLVVHFFNHQTHHRGQVHAMLTAAGARPGPTDLAFMPEDAG